jgi:hypothetical protein
MFDTIYTHCVYLTTYSGSLLPKYYIGSSTVEKVLGGYRGSVSSKQYAKTWKQECSKNPHLFETVILSYHRNAKDALSQELSLHELYDVVKSDKFVNKSKAKKNGMFGMDVSGEKNPMYGRSRKGETHNGGENISSALIEMYSTEHGQEIRRKSSERFKENNPSKDPEIVERNKAKWKETGRGVGEKNGMYGKVGRLKGKKLYNNGTETRAYKEGKQPDGWVLGRHKK